VKQAPSARAGQSASIASAVGGAGGAGKAATRCVFHPHEIVKELPAEMCLCEKGERVDGKNLDKMTQCDECLEWYHNDCAAIPDDVDPQWRRLEVHMVLGRG